MFPTLQRFLLGFLGFDDCKFIVSLSYGKVKSAFFCISRKIWLFLWKIVRGWRLVEVDCAAPLP